MNALHFPVGVVGVGNMGGAMAGRLLDLGWPVHVCDLIPERALEFVPFGAVAHDNPAQVAIKSEAVVLAVVDDTQCHDVLFGANGAAQNMRAGQVVVLCPTLSPQATESLASRLSASGIHTIDAPMSGGPVRARAGTMSLMVACEAAVYDRSRALLEALSDRVFRISERPGDGARTKLVNNLAAGINLVAAAEALAMAQSMGLNLQTTLEVMEQSSAQSWIGTDRMRRAIAGDFVPRAHMTLLEKDTGLAIAAARQAGFHGPLSDATHAAFAQASAAGLDELDDGAMLKWLMR